VISVQTAAFSSEMAAGSCEEDRSKQELITGPGSIRQTAAFTVRRDKAGKPVPSTAGSCSTSVSGKRAGIEICPLAAGFSYYVC
jgi:hypothetical protein